MVALPFDVTCSDIADIVDVQIVCKLCSDFWRLYLDFSVLILQAVLDVTNKQEHFIGDPTFL